MKYRLKQPWTEFRRVPIIQAIELYEDYGPISWKIQSLILARKSNEVIAKKLKLELAVVTCYENLFFDVRSRRQYRTWVSELFGAGPIFGFLEHDLARLWMWIACRRGTRALGLTIAITTGERREKYSEELLDIATLFIERARIRLDVKPERRERLDERIRIEDEGLHPSVYYKAMRLRRLAEEMPAEHSEKPTPFQSEHNPESP